MDETITPRPADLDPEILALVLALDAFEGIRAVAGCAGPPEPRIELGECSEGSWYVRFEVAETAEAWGALEFLLWLVNGDYTRVGHRVALVPSASTAPDVPNLTFTLEGRDGEDPSGLAEWIDRCREGYYTPPPAR
jgi:hypothetical protein